MNKIAIAMVAGMAAASAFAVPVWTSLVSEGAKGETEATASAYSAYYCTKAAAATMFGGNTAYDTVTAYLTKDAATYQSGMIALASGGTALGYYGFDEDEYAFSKYVKDGTAGDYLAVLAYTGALGEGDMVRVFSATADAAGSLTFAPADGKGEAGAWTTVPEPTSGLLLLLGVAGLALRRKSK